MKHRIVGDHHQLIAVTLNIGEELLIFEGKHIFSRGNIGIRELDQGLSFPGLPDGFLLSCSDGSGLAGIIPRRGGHLKRIEIGPPTGMVVSPDSVFILSRGITASAYNPPTELAPILEKANLIALKGVGVAFVRTDENFIEFTLGAEEELKASPDSIVAFSGGIKLNPGPAVAGESVVLFNGPGNLVLSSSLP